MCIQIQAIQATITWEVCSDLPTKLTKVKTMVINGKIYNCGSGVTEAISDANTVYCYDASQDMQVVRSTITSCQIDFGLGRLNSTLVAVPKLHLDLVAAARELVRETGGLGKP